MATKTELINKALTLVGGNPITNITDDTNNARIVNRVYDLSLRSILSECKWNFATRRDLLATAVVSLDWYYTNETYKYAKPSDIIRIFGTNDDSAIWREEGDYIFSDTKGLGIVYTAYIDDPSKYPASFTNAFIDLLCADIAFMIINSKTIGEAFQQKYETISLPKARSENAQQGTHQYLLDDAWEFAKDHNENTSA
jgi:hypothetical protein